MRSIITEVRISRDVKSRFMDMKGFEYINKTREYLDYLEEHLTLVHRAFCEINDACDGKQWFITDDYEWSLLMVDVRDHDLSKFSANEFVQYRSNFFPVSQEDKEKSGFDLAWEHHKANNHHHHESIETDNDVIHMLIDWMAMGYKFGGTVTEFYNKNKEKINLSDSHKRLLFSLMRDVEEFRSAA